MKKLNIKMIKNAFLMMFALLFLAFTSCDNIYDAIGMGEEDEWAIADPVETVSEYIKVGEKVAASKVNTTSTSKATTWTLQNGMAAYEGSTKGVKIADGRILASAEISKDFYLTVVSIKNTDTTKVDVAYTIKGSADGISKYSGTDSFSKKVTADTELTFKFNPRSGYEVLAVDGSTSISAWTVKASELFTFE